MAPQHKHLPNAYDHYGARNGWRQVLLTDVFTWGLFNSCRRAAWLYSKAKHLSYKSLPRVKARHALVEAVRCWHRTGSRLSAQNRIHDCYPDRGRNPAAQSMVTQLRGLLDGYIQQDRASDLIWRRARFHVAAPIQDPDSKRSDWAHQLGCAVDGVVHHDGDHWLVRHVLAGNLSRARARFKRDWRTAVTAAYAGEALDVPLVGALYNVMPNPSLDQTPAKQAGYQRVFLRFAPNQVPWAERHLWNLAGQMKQVGLDLKDHYPNYDVCRMGDTLCPYYTLCHQTPTQTWNPGMEPPSAAEIQPVERPNSKITNQKEVPAKPTHAAFAC